MQRPFRSKTRAAALALFLGVLGAHRFYLRGPRDVLAWLHLPLFVAAVWGLAAVMRDGLGGAAAPVGLPLAAVCLGLALFQALLLGLTPDVRWDEKWNAGLAERSHSGWGAVLVVMFSLLIGTAALAGGLAVALQRIFASQVA